jgi:hypothetical protein
MKKSFWVVFLLSAMVLSACGISGTSKQTAVSPAATEAAAVVVELPTSIPTETPVPQQMISVTTRTTSEDHTDQRYTIDVQMPVLNGPDAVVNTFNQVITQYTEKAIAEFRDAAIQAASDWVKGMPDTSSFISSETHLISLSPRLVSVSVSMHDYMVGAAHPNTHSVSFNYDLTDKKMLSLSDLFQPGADYLSLLSKTSLTELKKNPDLMIFEEGAAPKEENFNNWNITADGLQLTFDPYQVGPYAAGTQVVTIPYTTLKDILSPLGQELLFK